MGLTKPPVMDIEQDDARKKVILEIENINTTKERRDFLVFQLNLYDLVMGYKKLKEEN